MKIILLSIVIAISLTACASGPTAHQIVAQNLNPNLSFNELNSILKRKGYMRMNVKKQIGEYSLVNFANWELVFKGQTNVYADKLNNGHQAESWINSQLNNHVQSNKRIIIIE